MKVKCRLIFSIIMCLCLMNIGGVFSYAGGSSGGGGGGSSIGGSGSGGGRPAQAIGVQKMWLPNDKGDFGPSKDKAVTFNAKLSLKVKYQGQILNFETEKSKKTKKFNLPPSASNDFKSNSTMVAFFKFNTGTRLLGTEFDRYISDVTTLEDSDKQGYTCQFETNDLYLNPKTGEGKINRVLIYRTPRTQIPPPFDPTGFPPFYKDLWNFDNLEQPPANAQLYRDVDAKLTISEVEKFKDYTSKIEFEVLNIRPVPISLDGDTRVKVKKQNVETKDVKLVNKTSDIDAKAPKSDNENSVINDKTTKMDEQSSDVDLKEDKNNDKELSSKAKAPAAKAAAPVVDVPDVDIEAPDVDVKGPKMEDPNNPVGNFNPKDLYYPVAPPPDDEMVSLFRIRAVVSNTYNPPTPSNPPDEEEPPTPPSTTEKNPPVPPNTTEKNPTVPPKTTGKKVVKKSATPSTGDTENLFVLMSIMSVATLATITLIRRKKA